MGVEEIISVQISLSGANPTAANFGNGLFAAYHNAYTDRVRSYNSIAAVAVDFSTTSTVYAAASKFFAASPSPTTFKVGRRALAPTCVLALTILDATAGDTVSFTLEGKTITATASTTTALTATAVQAAIVSATLSTVSSTVSASVVTVTAASSGHVIRLAGWSRTQIDVENTTTDPGIQTDLNAIALADGDFYGFALDSQSKAELAQAAAWAEANKLKELFLDCSDGSIASTTTTDLFSSLKTSAYHKSIPLFNGQDTWAYSGVGLMAVALVNTPGSYTLDCKTIAGVTPDKLTDTEASNIQGKNGNVYRAILGLNLVTKGTNANGGFEDTERFKDWLTNTMQVRLLALLASVKKLPYTNKGVRAVGTVVLGTLQDGIRVNGISDDPDLAPTVQLPLPVSSISQTNITARNLPNVTFSATLAGAIQFIPIVGTLVGS